MKKQILTGIIALGMAAGAFAQSTITFDNGNADPAGTLASTHNGSVFTGTSNAPVLLNQDINLVLMGGASAGSLSVIASLIGAGAAGDNTTFGTAGQFADLSGNIYNVPGVAGGGTAFFDVFAWIGSDNSYAAAVAAGHAAGSSGVYSGPTGGGGIPAGPPTSAGDNMPSFLVTTSAVPEPTTLALCGLGAASLLLFRRKK